MSEPFWVPLGGGGGISLEYLGDYVPATTYKDGDVVVKDGIAYVCVGGPTTTAPDPAPWGVATPASSWTVGDTKVSAQPASHADGAKMWLLADGSAIPAQWTELIALIGANLPDAKGRGLVMVGTNADVNAIGKSDGVAVANRRPKHRHTAHTHTFTAILALHTNQGGGGGTQFTLGPQGSTTAGADGGSGNANDSLDAPAYVVVGNLFFHT